MKTKMLLLLVVSAASLSGCMVYPRYGHGAHREAGPTYIYGDGGNRGGHQHRSDRDGDGTPNRSDREPNNPRAR